MSDTLDRYAMVNFPSSEEATARRYSIARTRMHDPSTCHCMVDKLQLLLLQLLETAGDHELLRQQDQAAAAAWIDLAA